jgi:hypothetical protein
MGATGLNRRHRPVGIDVTGSRAVPELTDRVKCGDRLCDFRVRLRPELIGVTGCTVRLVGREFPNHRLRIRDVARITRDRHSMILIKRR